MSEKIVKYVKKRKDNLHICAENAKINVVFGKSRKRGRRKYTRKYNEGTEYESQYAYNSLFPVTQIRITLQNKKTKEKVVDYEYLYTLNRK